MMSPLPRLALALALVLTAPAPAQQAQLGPRVGMATIGFLDVGQGDAVLIRSPEGKTALVDAGPNGDIVQLLRDRGVDHLDLLATGEENNNSVGLRVRYGTSTALLPGDAQKEERRWWMYRAPELCTGCTVLKLAHHGSRNGTDARWLDLVRPRLAVASLGRANEYGHPHPEVLDLLERARVPLLRTDRDGSIALRTDGKHWEVVRSRPATRGPPVAAPADSAAAPPGRDRAPRVGARRVGINTAILQELEALPGIGPVLAGRIIAGRPYGSVEELDRVLGIGPKRLEKIRSLVTAQ